MFIGLENINPDNLLAAKKQQNKITDYRVMLQMWRNHGATTYAGYIIGMPHDTKETILRDIEIIKNELPVDLLEFFFLTPLPGSADHKKLLAEGVWMDPDLNKYDLFHRVAHHPLMSDEEWEEAYKLAWETFYTPEHIETIVRRVAAMPNGRIKRKIRFLFDFSQAYLVEGVHPLEGGVFRRKFRRDRCPRMPLVNPLIFYPAYFFETLHKIGKYGRAAISAYRMYRKISRDPERLNYTDLAITPPKADEMETLSLFLDTTGGDKAVSRKQQADRVRSEFAA